MKFIIHSKAGDIIVIEGETLEELRKRVYQEITKRCWKEDDCWSEEIK